MDKVKDLVDCEIIAAFSNIDAHFSLQVGQVSLIPVNHFRDENIESLTIEIKIFAIVNSKVFGDAWKSEINVIKVNTFDLISIISEIFQKWKPACVCCHSFKAKGEEALLSGSL